MRYMIYKHGFGPSGTGFEMTESKSLSDALRTMVDMLPSDASSVQYSSVSKNRIELGYVDGYLHLVMEK